MVYLFLLTESGEHLFSAGIYLQTPFVYLKNRYKNLRFLFTREAQNTPQETLHSTIHYGWIRNFIQRENVEKCGKNIVFQD